MTPQTMLTEDMKRNATLYTLDGYFGYYGGKPSYRNPNSDKTKYLEPGMVYKQQYSPTITSYNYYMSDGTHLYKWDRDGNGWKQLQQN